MPRLLPCRSPAFALLAMALACGSGGDSTSPNPPSPTGNLPAELLGEWHYQFLGIPNCNPDTGQCVSTANQSETLKFSSNGRFEHVFVGESNFPPCSMEVLHESEGTAEVQAQVSLSQQCVDMPEKGSRAEPGRGPADRAPRPDAIRRWMSRACPRTAAPARWSGAPDRPADSTLSCGRW
jgi:hypothetical protein